jgi:hypothetical protein
MASAQRSPASVTDSTLTKNPEIERAQQFVKQRCTQTEGWVDRGWSFLENWIE